MLLCSIRGCTYIRLAFSGSQAKPLTCPCHRFAVANLRPYEKNGFEIFTQTRLDIFWPNDKEDTFFEPLLKLHLFSSFSLVLK